MTVARAAKPGAVITDAGSTKAELVSAIEGQTPQGVHFVGSHPLAGGSQTGFEHSDPDLFVARRVVVTPTENSHPDAVSRVNAFWRALGAETHELSPRRHDEIAAAISHAPHLVAASLAGSVADSALEWAASGWRDATRIAAGDPDLWQAIIAANRGPVLKSLLACEKVLAQIRQAVEQQGRRGLGRDTARGQSEAGCCGRLKSGRPRDWLIGRPNGWPPRRQVCKSPTISP